MKVHYKIIQGTEDWHRIKYGKIGGTASKGLFVESDTLLNCLIAQKLEEFQLDDDGYTSYDMQRGIELEPLARKALCEYTGLKFMDAGWIDAEHTPLIGISPDGITKDLKSSCEIKCPGMEKHTKNLLCKEIPSDNIHQCLHYFTVNTKLKQHFFCSFRPESKHPLFVRKLALDSLINLGTKAKPVLKSIKEWSEIARAKAIELNKNIETSLTMLEF